LCAKAGKLSAKERKIILACVAAPQQEPHGKAQITIRLQV